jgi:hypothetical protein
MKWIGAVLLALLAGCQARHPAPAPPSRPLMEADLAAKLCTNPGAVSVFGAECVLRDQSPPVRLLPPMQIPK